MLVYGCRGVAIVESGTDEDRQFGSTIGLIALQQVADLVLHDNDVDRSESGHPAGAFEEDPNIDQGSGDARQVLRRRSSVLDDVDDFFGRQIDRDVQSEIVGSSPAKPICVALELVRSNE